MLCYDYTTCQNNSYSCLEETKGGSYNKNLILSSGWNSAAFHSRTKQNKTRLRVNNSSLCLWFNANAGTFIFFAAGTLQSSPLSTSPSGSQSSVPEDSDSDLAFSVNRSSSASESSLGTLANPPFFCATLCCVSVLSKWVTGLSFVFLERQCQHCV